ncbi:hypothetical protein SVAN01_05326 [Stagonosporopsis vannaccii]|nr:hypothetical protein SVAN01_05326 [Stagonosporopsis vannaccii]
MAEESSHGNHVAADEPCHASNATIRSLLEIQVPEAIYTEHSRQTPANDRVSPPIGQSMLLGLPAELRNRIYELVLCHSEGIRVDEEQEMIEAPVGFMAITETCRQTHSETRLLPFSLNTFIVDFNMIRWLRTLDDDRRRVITSIEISYTVSMCMEHSGDTWHSDPGWQNKDYLQMLLMTLPGLRHLNLAMNASLSTPLSHDRHRLHCDYGERTHITPDQSAIDHCLEPFRASFGGPANGVVVTTKTNLLRPCYHGWL